MGWSWPLVVVFWDELKEECECMSPGCVGVGDTCVVSPGRCGLNLVDEIPAEPLSINSKDKLGQKTYLFFDF